MVECSKEEMEGRKAWRALLVPAVGSAAFFSSMMVNMITTHNKYGWPHKAFKSTDYLLMTIPFVVIGLAIGEVVNEEAAQGE